MLEALVLSEALREQSTGSIVYTVGIHVFLSKKNSNKTPVFQATSYFGFPDDTINNTEGGTASLVAQTQRAPNRASSAKSVARVSKRLITARIFLLVPASTCQQHLVISFSVANGDLSRR